MLWQRPRGFRLHRVGRPGRFSGNSITQRDLYAEADAAIDDDQAWDTVFTKAQHQFCGLQAASDGTANKLPPAIRDALRPDGSDIGPWLSQ